MWVKMATVVKIDERGRVTLPKDFCMRSGRAAVISAGTFLVFIPISSKPAEAARGWLKSKRERAELKKIAEKRAREDAVSRAKRRERA